MLYVVNNNFAKQRKQQTTQDLLISIVFFLRTRSGRENPKLEL
jgi:hypothetical protein